MSNRTAGFCTLGCRVNQYETRAIEELFISNGFTLCSFSQKCDVYVINTCTVTAESDRKSRQIIRRARKNGGENAVIIVTGCMSQVDPKEALKIQGVDALVGNHDKLACLEVALDLLEKKKNTPINLVKNIFDFDEIEKMSVCGSDNTRAFLKIADGCENNCSYCIIPGARGKIRSKTIEDINAECINIIKSGCREIVFTGIETAGFGKDTGLTLADLAERVSLLDNLMRIRFGSLEPTVITEDFAKRLSKLPNVMPHFHLSLQSGSDTVLARMRRKYNTKMFLEKLEILRKYIPDAQITTDIIVGFPGETEQEFSQTMAFVEKAGLLFAHIFPYSDRKNTDASKMAGKLADGVKKSRALTLDKKMRQVRTSVIEKYIGTTRPVLWEQQTDGYFHGYTDNYIEVRLSTQHGLTFNPNDITNVVLEKISQNAEYVLCSPANN